MVATTNLPGSQHFNYFIGTRAECGMWLEIQLRRHQEVHGGVWTSTYLPARVVSNKLAATWRYLDGRKVIRFNAED